MLKIMEQAHKPVIISTIQREDKFRSKYFDRQISYRSLLRLSDGNTIESSAYQHFFGSTPTDLAIDISTMVGCPMECKFCEAALIHYVRALSVDEMISQVVEAVEKYDTYNFPKIVCSFQGIGEPSLIPETILKTGAGLLEIDQRIAISISTVGARLRALKLWRESEVPIDNLQISSSGTTSAQINLLMPRTPTLDELLNEAKLCAMSPNIQKVKINYILVQDHNDSDQDVHRLISLFKNTPITLKISALNPTVASRRQGLNPGTLERAQQMCRELQSNGIASFVFGSFNSINVSCGQLAFVE